MYLVWGRLGASFVAFGCWEAFKFCPSSLSVSMCRDHSGLGLDQWEKALHNNASSHWLSPYPEWWVCRLSVYIFDDGNALYAHTRNEFKPIMWIFLSTFYWPIGIMTHYIDWRFIIWWVKLTTYQYYHIQCHFVNTLYYKASSVLPRALVWIIIAITIWHYWSRVANHEACFNKSFSNSTTRTSVVG